MFRDRDSKHLDFQMLSDGDGAAEGAQHYAKKHQNNPELDEIFLIVINQTRPWKKFVGVRRHQKYYRIKNQHRGER